MASAFSGFLNIVNALTGGDEKLPPNALKTYKEYVNGDTDTDLTIKSGKLIEEVESIFSSYFNGDLATSLNKYHIDGDLDFTGTYMTEKEIIVKVKYNVKLALPYFGNKLIKMEQNAKVKLMRKI